MARVYHCFLKKMLEGLGLRVGGQLFILFIIQIRCVMGIIPEARLSPHGRLSVFSEKENLLTICRRQLSLRLSQHSLCYFASELQ